MLACSTVLFVTELVCVHVDVLASCFDVLACSTVLFVTELVSLMCLHPTVPHVLFVTELVSLMC